MIKCSHETRLNVYGEPLTGEIISIKEGIASIIWDDSLSNHPFNYDVSNIIFF